MLKPEKLEGSFRSLLSKEQVLEIARQNQGRDLAVVVIGIYPTKAEEDLVMQGWLEPLKAMGYRQTLFLRGGRELEVKGLPIVQNSEPVTAFSGTGS